LSIYLNVVTLGLLYTEVHKGLKTTYAIWQVSTELEVNCGKKKLIQTHL